MEYKINSQNDTIDIVLLALKETILGQGITIACDVEVERGDYGSTIVFTPNGIAKVTPEDFFWLGYFVGRDYKASDFAFTIAPEKRKKYKRVSRSDE